jgi:chemotaxis protein MotB
MSGNAGHGKGSTKGTSKGHRKHKGGHEEEHENHERWLVSYADMMTLLMVLFIVLFAISAVDQKKFAELKNGLAVGFGSPSVAFDGGETSLMESSNEDSPMDIASGVGSQATKVQDQAVKDAVAAVERARAQARQKAAKQEIETYEEIKAKITEAMEKSGLADNVRFTVDERGLVVTIVTSSVVFAGDRAELLPAGQRILDAVGPTIAALPNRIEVDGHTNQLPAQTVNYPSGWELSTARASSVVRYLNEHAHIPKSRLFAAGYADTKPMYPPSDPKAPTLNRRVEIVVLSNLPADTRALLPSAASDGMQNHASTK